MSRVIRLPYARKNRVWELAIRHSAIESQFIDTRAAFAWSVLLIGRRASPRKNASTSPKRQHHFTSK